MIATRMRPAIVAVGVMTAALGLSASAGADPVGDPCQLAAVFLCRFFPIAPDLDHDIDLTQQSGAAAGEPAPSQDGGGVAPDGGPPGAPTNWQVPPTDQR